MLNIRMRKIVFVIGVFTVLFVIYHLSYSLSNSSNAVNQPVVAKLGANPMFEEQSLNDKGKSESSVHKSLLRDKYTDSMADLPPLFSGQKIVHLDLKGAPMKVSYYKEIFPLLRTLGTTGLLLEYEDMFPYSSSDVKASNAYSVVEIKSILDIAEENQLEVIPLVQTFGHLEFVLKLKEYSNLREVPRYPQVISTMEYCLMRIELFNTNFSLLFLMFRNHTTFQEVICPSRNGTLELLTGMVDDIIALHPASKYIHIGCDEVYFLAECSQCLDKLLKNNWNKQQLFLSHVYKIAKYIKDKYPKVTPLVWDDEFRKMSMSDLTNSKIGGLVEPVVWKYTPMLDFSEDIWDKYSAIFGSVWIASAFKGATGADKYTTDINYHLENHRSWMRLVMAYKDHVHFKGIAITGWQRYDHFAVLCELFPVGLPSLAVNLAYLSQGDLEMQRVPRSVTDLLRCGPGLLSGPRFGTRCHFPGSVVYDKANQLSFLVEQVNQMLDASQIKGWMTDYNVHAGFSSPAHVESGTSDLDRLKMELIYLEQEMTRAMGDVFEPDTTSEWIYTFVRPVSLRLQALWDAKEKLLSTSVWPRRPIQVHDQL